MSNFLGYQLKLFTDPNKLGDPFEFNFPLFKLTNNSSLSTIVGFELTIGKTAFNFDSAENPQSSPGIQATLISPDTEGFGGVRSDVLSYTFTGFRPGSFFQGNIDIDSDNRNSVEDFRQVLFDLDGSNSSNNAIVTVTFDNGTVLSDQLPDFAQTADNAYKFSRSTSDLDLTSPDNASIFQIDFDEGHLAAGTLITDQFEGFSVSTPSEFGVMIFDSNHPTAGDRDLGAFVGNVLIISEDGDSSAPDDNAAGGTISIEFDRLTTVTEIGLLDIEESGGSVRFFDEQSHLIEVKEILPLGDGDLLQLGLNVPRVARMDVHLAGSGALTNLGFLQEFNAPVANDDPFPRAINLSDLNGNNGFVLNGNAVGDSSGSSVSNAGDINGDGIDDLIIGAPGAAPNGNNLAGESYVVFGGNHIGSSGTIKLSDLNGNNGFVLNGIAVGDSSGSSVSNAGDINGDGIDDLIIGASGAAPNRNNDAGESYVVFGGNHIGSSGTIELSSLDGSNGFVLNGIDEEDLSGFSVSNAGDINGDGFDDLIVGAILADPNGSASGESYLVFGGSHVGNSGTIELSSLDGSNGFALNGIKSNDFSGYSVSNAGDINGDGTDDLIIGAVFASRNEDTVVGQSYVVFGGSHVGISGTIELSDLDGSNGFVINAIDLDRSGFSVSNVGDFNGDGTDDLIVGSPSADSNGNSDTGQSYVIFGGSHVGSSGTIELSDLDGSNGFALNGNAVGDVSGSSVSNAGDINGDGIDDLIIGAPRAAPNDNNEAGQSYVVFGGSHVGSSGTIELSELDGSNGFALNGIAEEDLSGFSVSNAGDLNDDGVDDLIIGASGADPNGNNRAGASYVVFGRDFNTDEDTTFTTSNVLTNDIDVDGDTLTITSIDTTGTLGIVTNNGDGTFDYDPNGQFDTLITGQSATDSFSYTITDGNGGFDTATVTITINGITDETL